MNLNFLTFDVEDWYEGYRIRGLSGWEDIASKDTKVVEELLDVLLEFNQSATFFFTGRFALKNKNLVRQCLAMGHEIASHSQEHNLITHLNRNEFRNDLRRSISTLSEITGKAVIGYRAPKWSVTLENEQWVFNELIDAGLKYDSSFFPKIGADARRKSGELFKINVEGKGSLIEIPAPGLNVFNWTLPVAGGFYFRVLPFWLVRRMLIQRRNNRSYGMIYLHPYDLDSTSAKEVGGNFLLKLSRTYGVDNALQRLQFLMQDYRFSSIEKNLMSLRPHKKIDIGAI